MSKVITYIRTMFSTPSADVLASLELEESKRELLKSQAHMEYSSKMVEYHQGKIARLTKFLKTVSKEQEQS